MPNFLHTWLSVYEGHWYLSSPDQYWSSHSYCNWSAPLLLYILCKISIKIAKMHVHYRVNTIAFVLSSIWKNHHCKSIFKPDWVCQHCMLKTVHRLAGAGFHLPSDAHVTLILWTGKKSWSNMNKISQLPQLCCHMAQCSCFQRYWASHSWL